MRIRQRQKRWQVFDLSIDAFAVPRRAGVYAIYNVAGELIYIGSSGNVRTRIVEHRRKADWLVRSCKVSFMRGGWYRREQRLVRRVLPSRNIRRTFRNKPSHHLYA